MTLVQLLAVGAGSALGGMARYTVARLMASIPAIWPWGTFAVNVIGCFLLGAFGTYLGLRGHDTLKLLLTVGFCGGFTTFSTFVSESTVLWSAGHTLTSALYIGGSITAGVAGLLAGTALAKTL